MNQKNVSWPIVGLALALVLTVAVDAPALASGGSSSSTPAVSATPAEKAQSHYNAGISARNKAWKQEGKLADAEGAEAEKLQKKIQANFERAIREYRSAISNDPEMVEAYSSLGYALRKTGDFRNALSAYNTALKLNPEYTEALEYRGEAWLGLNQPELAKKDYTVLVGLNKEHAAELLQSMQAWLASGKWEGEVEASKIGEIRGWVEEEMGSIGDMAKNDGRKGSW